MDTKTIARCKQLFAEADAFLIGAGVGLSAATGLEYSGKRFTDNFADYIARYQVPDMYSATFYAFPTLEERWGYFSRHVKLNRFDAPVGKAYSHLLETMKDKYHFVITTNVDAQFTKAGFTADKVFATQGDYGKFQCEKACHDTLYDNEKVINEMVRQQSDCRIPSELVPICPVCGEGLVVHLRVDEYFVKNDDWQAASQRYARFVQVAQNMRLVLLELGVGFNTPSIIRWPFEKIAAAGENSTLIRVNKEHAKATFDVPDENIMIEGDIVQFINALMNA